MSVADDLRWIGPWEPVTVEAARDLEAELLRELTPSHPLFGAAARAVGRRVDRDDVAFELASIRLAVVHLTWSGRPDPRPAFPRSDDYESAASLQAQIDADAAEYTL